MVLMSNYLKYLRAEFEKYAQDIGLPPPGPKANRTAPSHSTPAGHGASDTFDYPHRGGAANNWGGVGSNTAIMAMQHALQDLAQAVSSQINLQDVSSGDPRKEQEAKARDAFGIFLTKNYMRNTKVPGIEYDPDPKVTDVSQKRPDDPTRMSVVMDTMNRVGNPKKGEQFVDGQWGPRTNAAVRDVYAFASGLFDFVNDVNRFSTKKMQINSYNKESLQNLADMATVNNSLTLEQKSEAAPLVTQHVKAIKNMYEEVKNNVLEHAAYRQFIEADVPFKTYQPKFKVTSQQLELLRKSFPQGFMLDFGNIKIQLGIDDLINLQALQAKLQKIVPDGKISPQQVVSQIWDQQKSLSTDPGY